MSTITHQTRQLSFEDIQLKKKIRYEQILNRLIKGKKTAKEIAVELFELKLIPNAERNYTAPRLTELEKIGLVKTKDKKICQYTGKKVAIYEITLDGIKKYKSLNRNGTAKRNIRREKGCESNG
jgi:hypothetical protein